MMTKDLSRLTARAEQVLAPFPVEAQVSWTHENVDTRTYALIRDLLASLAQLQQELKGCRASNASFVEAFKDTADQQVRWKASLRAVEQERDRLRELVVVVADAVMVSLRAPGGA